MRFDDMSYEQRIEYIRKYEETNDKRWENPYELRYYEECLKNREHHDRSFGGLLGAVVVFIILTIVSILFPEWFADDSYFVSVGRFAISYIIAYALFPVFRDLFSKK